MANLAKILVDSARKKPDKVAILFGQREITYHFLNYSVDRLAQGLKGVGIGQGDRVILMLPNIPQFPISYYALLKIGAQVIPVNIMFRKMEIRHLAGDSGAKVVIGWEGVQRNILGGIRGVSSIKTLIFLGEKIPKGAYSLTELIRGNDPLPKMEKTAADDTAVIQYTAGITGPPKGAELTHQNMISNAVSCKSVLGVGARDRLLAALPLFHPFGQTTMMNLAFVAGATMVLHHRFVPSEILTSLEENGITLFAGVPSMFQALINYPNPEKVRFKSLRYCVSGGAPLSASTLTAFEEKFDTTILEGYGLSETSPVVCLNQPHRPRKPGSVGFPIPGEEMKIVDQSGQKLPPGEVGEIIVQGENVMKGYLGRQEATEEVLRGGWFHTGDLGRKDEEGYFYVVGRKHELIIKSGFNVYPREIEDLLLLHPRVAEAAVIGIPDPEKGEDIKAFIVSKKGESITPEEIIDYCREKMDPYKCPREVEFVPTLPRNSSGRLLKSKLKG
ncbi:long-chain fatty acid--CoA ligase [candidate division KSB1 bacterium]|nr:long-chain fatty acid--CoA ligase [candidate division KSB1 bacterium]